MVDSALVTKRSIVSTGCLRFHFRTGMSENLDRLVELLHFQGLFQHCNWTNLQDSIENFAIGITRNNDYVQIWIDLFCGPIYLITWGVRKLQIEEH